MIDAVTLAKARSEIGRLNQQLVDIHLEEERLRLRRSRLESEKARVQGLVDLCELTQRLAETSEPVAPSLHIERVAGARVVVLDKPLVPAAPMGRRKHKPDGLPSMSVMIIAALKEAGKAERPVEITDYVRKHWWPTVSSNTVGTAAWHLAKIGRLTLHDGYYGLNGVGY